VNRGGDANNEKERKDRAESAVLREGGAEQGVRDSSWEQGKAQGLPK